MSSSDDRPLAEPPYGVSTFLFAGTDPRKMHEYVEAGPLNPQAEATGPDALLHGSRLGGSSTVAYASLATGVRLISPGVNNVEAVTLHVSDAGRAVYGDRTLWIRSETSPYDIDAAEDRAVLSLAVPLDRLIGPTDQLDLRAGVAVEANPVALGAFRSVMTVLAAGVVADWTTHSPLAVDRYLIGIVGLITSTILTSRDSTEDKQSLLRLRAGEIIEAQSDDPTLSPGKIAAQLAVSLRSLHRAFEGHPGVAEALRQRRLEHAATLLANPTMRYMPVNEISRRAGFSSITTFDRAFHLAYQLSPVQYRVRRSALGRG